MASLDGIGAEQYEAVGRVTAGPWLLAAMLAAAAFPAAGQNPWIITDPVTIAGPMEYTGDIIVASGGILEIKEVRSPGFRLTGNLLVVGSGEVRITSSVYRVMSTYHGQYFLAAVEDGTVTISGSDYRVPNGVQHGLIAAERGIVTISDTDFNFVQLLVTQQGTLTAERLTGTFEVILQEAGQLTLRDIPRGSGNGELWVWPEFPVGSTAIYTPPMPGFVQSWSFPPPGASGFRQRCTLERCRARLWPFLVRAGSDVTVRDVPEANWIVIGLHMPTDGRVEGLSNGETYASRDLGFADRRLVLENTSVDTWNFYPQGQARVTFRDCLLGEILAMDDSLVTLERVTIDGSGGYFGVEGDAVMEAVDSTFTCDVQVSDNGTASFRRSHLLPYPFDLTGQYTRFGAHDTGRLLLDASEATSTPVVGGSGAIAVTGIANPPSAAPGPDHSVDLVGYAALFTNQAALVPIGWRLEARADDESAPLLLGSGVGNLEGGLLGTWSGVDPRHAWTLRIVLTDGWQRTLEGVTAIDAAPRTRRLRPASP